MSGRSRRWRRHWAKLDCNGTFPRLFSQRWCWPIWKHNGESSYTHFISVTFELVREGCRRTANSVLVLIHSFMFASNLQHASWKYSLRYLFNKMRRNHKKDWSWLWLNPGQMLWLAGLPGSSHSLCLWCTSRSTLMILSAGWCRITSWSSTQPYMLSNSIQTVLLRHRDSYRRYEWWNQSLYNVKKNTFSILRVSHIKNLGSFNTWNVW